jgi:Uma2 family endonuclease
MAETARIRPRMDVAQYLDWYETRPENERFELLDGEPILMAPERSVHAILKMEVARQFDDQLRVAGIRCRTYPDGMSVPIGDDTVLEPDALVRCGPPLGEEAVLIPDPIVVVEVTSPSSQRIDAVQKFDRYFRVPSLRRYLIVVTKDRSVLRHRKEEDGRIVTTSHRTGILPIDPPGISLDIAALFARLEGI